LDWRLFDFGGREANRRMSTAMLDAAIATHDAVLQKTLESVIGAYFDAQTAKATWDAKRMNEDLARNTFEAAQRREARGAGAQTETLQAATALAKATLERGRSRGDYLKALSILTYAVGLPPETALSLAPDLTDDTVALERDLTQWLDDAQQRHPAIVAARAQVEAAREKVTTTRSDGLPSIDFTFNNYQNGRPSEGFPTIRTNEKVVGLTLTIPVFEGFARTYKVSGARAQVEQKQADLEDTAHQVLMDVVKAHADAQSALGNLDASHALLDVAQSAMDTVQRKFDRGATDILEILNTQAALSDANLERIRCLSEWRSARLRLLAASGALGRWEVLR
jgi:outer membrane protein